MEWCCNRNSQYLPTMGDVRRPLDRPWQGGGRRPAIGPLLRVTGNGSEVL